MRDGSLFLNFLSDFWTTVWQDKQLLSTAIGAQVEVLFRLYLQSVRIAAPDFIDNLNIFQEDFWNLIFFDESARVSNFKYQLPERYKTLPFLYNKMFNPTLVLREGVDYTLEQDVVVSGGQTATLIVFASDPFLNPAYPVGEPNQVKTLMFFAPKVLIDNDDLYKIFGNLVKIVQPSGEQYRQLVKGAMSLYAKGPILFLMNSGLSLAAGYPIARDTDRVLGITNDATNYIIRTAKGAEYLVPLVASLSVQVDSTLIPLQSLIRDIQVVDYISEPEWWKGGTGNTNPEFRVVNYISEDLAPDLATDKRDDLVVIDHLFNTFFKYHVFGMRINTLALQNFDAIESFFDLVFDVKPSYTSPYINAFFKAEVIFDLPSEVMEIPIEIDLTHDQYLGDTADYAERWVFPRDLIMNSEVVLNSQPTGLFDTAYDRTDLGLDLDLVETHRIEGGQDIMNSMLVLGAALLDGTRELLNMSADLDLDEPYTLGSDLVHFEVYDEDLLTSYTFGDALLP